MGCDSSVEAASKEKKLIITYFDGYGRGEPARMMLAHAKVDFVDDRVQQGKMWDDLKFTKFGGKSLPVLTVPSGKQLSQSQAVFRLIARRNGYYPSNVEVQLDHDWIIENYVDLFDPTVDATLLEQDPKAREDKQNKLFNEIWPRFIESLRPYLKGPGRFLFGDKLCEADFMVGRMYTDYIVRKDQPCFDKWRALLNKYPEFEAYGNAFTAEMKPYLDKRPFGGF